MLVRDGGQPVTVLVRGSGVGRLPAWLAGMSRPDMQALFTAMQGAYQKLSLGSMVVTASYGQGDGTRSVTFRQANMPQMAAQLAELARVLGYDVQQRRPLVPYYR